MEVGERGGEKKWEGETGEIKLAGVGGRSALTG